MGLCSHRVAKCRYNETWWSVAGHTFYFEQLYNALLSEYNIINLERLPLIYRTSDISTGLLQIYVTYPHFVFCIRTLDRTLVKSTVANALSYSTALYIFAPSICQKPVYLPFHPPLSTLRVSSPLPLQCQGQSLIRPALARRLKPRQVYCQPSRLYKYPDVNRDTVRTSSIMNIPTEYINANRPTPAS